MDTESHHFVHTRPHHFVHNYQAELVSGPAKMGPWKTIDDLELATLGWVHWHNTGRLHGYLGDVPPAEFEAAFYAGITSAKELAEIK